jgi:hypothetical protein
MEQIRQTKKRLSFCLSLALLVLAFVAVLEARPACGQETNTWQKFSVDVHFNDILSVRRVWREPDEPIMLKTGSGVEVANISVPQVTQLADEVLLCPNNHGWGNVWFFSSRIPEIPQDQTTRAAFRNGNSPHMYSFGSIALILTNRAPGTYFEQVIRTYRFDLTKPGETAVFGFPFVLPQVDSQTPYGPVVKIDREAGCFLFYDAPGVRDIRAGTTFGTGKNSFGLINGSTLEFAATFTTFMAVKCTAPNCGQDTIRMQVNWNCSVAVGVITGPAKNSIGDANIPFTTTTEVLKSQFGDPIDVAVLNSARQNGVVKRNELRYRRLVPQQ